MRRIWALVFALGAVLASACVSTRLTQRYGALVESTRDAESELVRFSAFALAVPAPGPQDLVTRLSDRAQAQLVDALATKLAGAELLTALSPAPKPAKPRMNLTELERRLVLSIENQTAHPGDRIARAVAEIDLAASAPQASFAGWNQFSTSYAVADYGTAKLSQGSEVSIGAKLAPGVVEELGEASASAKASRNLEETLALKLQYASATGTLTKKTFRFVQQGAPDRDLMGNAAIDLSLVVGDPAKWHYQNVVSFGDLFDKGAPVASDKVAVREGLLTYVDRDECRALSVDVRLTGSVRRILKGGKSVAEGDDRATFEAFETKSPGVELVPVRDLQANVWQIRRGESVLHIEVVPGLKQPLEVISFAEALALQGYLLRATFPPAQPLSVGGAALSLGNVPLTADGLRNLQVAQVKLNW